MEEKSKVEQRREEAIRRAVANGDWGRVDDLLNEPYENLTRKDRQYGLLSLDSSISGDADGLIDMITDNSDPLTNLIKKEERCRMREVFSRKLSERERKILFGRILDGKTYLRLAREVGLSDKTVKQHYEKIIEILQKELKNF